jgi:hypothetical protein
MFSMNSNSNSAEVRRVEIRSLCLHVKLEKSQYTAGGKSKGSIGTVFPVLQARAEKS